MSKKEVFFKILKGRLIFAAFLLGACFVFTQWVIPVIHKPSATFILSEAGERQLLRFRKNLHSGNVHALKIRIRGQLNGTALIRVFDSENPEKVRREKVVGSGEIDTRMDGDWYSNDCRMEYLPLSADHGGLKIEYRFETTGKEKEQA